MNVLLISQCSKNALKETRRILDQFAERRGDRTWQTPITWEGLATLRKMLKKRARKNTAVACHWIRGKDHSELLWIVGDQSRFNAEGAVPTNITTRNILRSQDENPWRTAEVIALLAAIAGLFHDFGKATVLFQYKLQPDYTGKGSEPVRHEWLSLRLFLAFIGEDADQQWLERLQEITPEFESVLLSRFVKDTATASKNPFKAVLNRPIALTVAWLIVCHHRLPQLPKQQNSVTLADEVDGWICGKQFKAGWNSPQIYNDDWRDKDWNALWDFSQKTPLSSQRWCAKAHSFAKRALKHHALFGGDWLEDRFTCHLARLVLMLSDHCYSAAEPTLLWQDRAYDPVANTDRKTGQPKQKLDEHNIGVGHHAFLLARRLPNLQRSLPAITRLKALKKRGRNPRFSWQDKAYDLARSIGQRTEAQGFFGINMASTGCGKTLANARVMYGLANEKKGCRFNVALGLRTLTLQTGDDFRQKLHLNEEDLAVLVGSQAVKALHEMQQTDQLGERSGSESLAEVLDDGQHLVYEGSLEDSVLKEWLQRSPKLQQLVSAPVLVSTIDYLMPATEGGRGGKQIAPMLRLLTSDLVLDEPDDFGLEDLPALCRLVNWAGMLGSRVLLSSATLPPSLVQALFAAYCAGRKAYNRACGEPGLALPVSCAWFDEFGTQQADHHQPEAFAADHETFIRKRVAKLQRYNQALRRGALLPITAPSTKSEDVVTAVAALLQTQIPALHQQHHQTDPATQKTVSLGLVRMANINPLVAVAQALLSQEPPEDVRLHFCVYHSQFPLLVRSRMEEVLDKALDRNNPQNLWENSSIRNALDGYLEQHHIFVVLGTAVTEVGRDHDYDWAIAEPSSMRSLIQLAGRIQRHRRMAPAVPNLLIFSRNMRALRGSEVAYKKPGFESKTFKLTTHDLHELLLPEQYEEISAIPRILPRQPLHPSSNLADLEHCHLQAQLFGHPETPFSASLWWEHNPTWCFEVQRQTPFRQSAPEELFILFQEDESDEPQFNLVTEDGRLITAENRFKRIELNLAERVSPWISCELNELLAEFAEHEEMELAQCSRRFTEMRLRESEGIWYFHQTLGAFAEY